MKTLSLALVLTLLCNALFAQTAADSIPAYQKIGTIPPFKLMLAPDSIAFSKEDLKRKKATVIMVFSPDCEHCIHSTEDMLAHYDLLKKAQIIMGTPLAYEHIQKFYTDFKIADYPNIKVGLDNSYFLGTFYDLRMYPAIFVYDKKGKFKKAFPSDAKWEAIAKAL